MDTAPRVPDSRRLMVVLVAAALCLALSPGRALAADTEAPSTPGAPVVVSATTSSVTLTWTASTDNVGVVSYQVPFSYTDIVDNRNTSTTNSITIGSLRASMTYRFAVVAFDAAGNRSYQSPGLTFTMPPGDTVPPTAPGRPVVTALAPTALTLSWPASRENVSLSRYRVHRLVDGQPVPVYSVPQHPGGLTSARLQNLTPATAYTFVVDAVDDAGNISALSPAVSVTTPTDLDVTPPTAPGTPVAGAVGTTSVQLSWAPSADPSGIAQYRVYGVTDGSAPVLRTTVAGATTAIVTGLEPANTYVFQVVAVDLAGNLSAPSGRVTVSTPARSETCEVTYRIVAQWPGGFQASVSIRNLTTAQIPYTSLSWQFPDNQVMTRAWQVGQWTMTGATATVTAPSWYPAIHPTSPANFGFQGTWSGTNGVPTAFRLNGVLCVNG